MPHESAACCMATLHMLAKVRPQLLKDRLLDPLATYLPDPTPKPQGSGQEKEAQAKVCTAWPFACSRGHVCQASAQNLSGRIGIIPGSWAREVIHNWGSRRNPRFVVWPLELRLGTCNPRFVASPP